MGHEKLAIKAQKASTVCGWTVPMLLRHVWAASCRPKSLGGRSSGEWSMVQAIGLALLTVFLTVSHKIDTQVMYDFSKNFHLIFLNFGQRLYFLFFPFNKCRLYFPNSFSVWVELVNNFCPFRLIDIKTDI